MRLTAAVAAFVVVACTAALAAPLARIQVRDDVRSLHRRLVEDTIGTQHL